jgi:ABC-2 type transport system ATP-binding protein
MIAASPIQSPLQSADALNTDAMMPPVADHAVIELDGLSVRFSGRPILENLRATVRGRTIGLLGPNGAGKTTLIHTLLGFHSPSAGHARIFGLDAGREIKRVRAMVGYMPEREAFVGSMKCVEFVQLMGELSGLPRSVALERAHEALFYVGLGEARYRKLQTFSLGMKQMAKLAQALVHGPRLIFLDEPTNGLDPVARQRMISLIQNIRQSGEAHIVLSSHLLRDVEECCEEVLILKSGRIVSACNLEEERRANRNFLMLELRGSIEPFANALTATGCECAVSGEGRMKVVLEEAVEIRDLYRIAEAHKIQIRRLAYKRDSLEEIFLKAMEGAEGSGPYGRL